MWKFYGIAHGIDIGCGGLQIFIHPNATHFAQFQYGILSQTGFGTNTYAKQHHIGFESDSRLEIDLNGIVYARKTLHGLLEIEFHTLLQQMFVHYGGHRVVDRAHHLRSHLHHSHFGSSVLEIFSHFESYKSAAHYHSTTHFVVGHILLNAVGVTHISEGKDAFTVDAG